MSGPPRFRPGVPVTTSPLLVTVNCTLDDGLLSTTEPNDGLVGEMVSCAPLRPVPLNAELTDSAPPVTSSEALLGPALFGEKWILTMQLPPPASAMPVHMS